VRRLREELAKSVVAFREVFRNSSLRRLSLALTGSELGDWGATIAFAVLAFDASGPTGVGVMLLIRMVPAAIAAPFTSILGDRLDRVLVLLSTDLVRAAAMAIGAVLAFADAPIGAIYAIAGFVAVASTIFRPAQAALLPSLARTPDELTAANVASSTIESVTSFGGPAIGGVVLAITEPGVSFAVASGTYLWSAALISLIPRMRAEGERAAPETGEGVMATVTAGARAIWEDHKVRLLVGIFGVQTIVAGALNVLVVVLALEVLRTGEDGLGALNAALGVGGLLGAIGAVALVGRRRLAGAFGAGTLLWSAPLALIAVWENQIWTLVLLGLVGLANTVVDVAGFTILQRAVPDDVLARVFGILDSVFLGTAALGGLVASAIIEGAGADWALVAFGLFLPVVVIATWRRVVTIDEEARVPEREFELLRGIPFLSLLPGPALEDLALRLLPVTIPAGEVIMREGAPGDRFYVIDAGEVSVTHGSDELARLGSGDFFGEIALLRDVPRTASVTTLTDSSLFALERDDFIAAVTGHAPSAEAAGAVVSSRLSARRPGLRGF
jgi:MFS family permease